MPVSNNFIKIFIFLFAITGKISSQEYPVGFDAHFIKDYSRKTDSLEYRPVLFNIWYPGEKDNKKQFMCRKELLHVKGSTATEIKWSNSYYAYALSSLKGYLFDQFESSDSAFIDKEFDMYLSTATRFKNKLKPVNNKFPLVIYHQGLGGTIDDNLALCEYLASKGCVVIGSTFFQSIQWMGPGNEQYSRQDLDMLINEAAKYDFIDLSYIVYVGHSYGAQTGFTYINQDGCPISLFISLDTTFDYENDAELDERGIIPQIKSRSHLVKIPTVHFSDFQNKSKPLFEIPRRHIYSDRLLITPRNRIRHDGFVNLGYYEAKLLKKYDPDYDIDTIMYPKINQLIFNLIKLKPALLSQEIIDTNYFHSDYIPGTEAVRSMSFYDTLEQKYGVDSVLHLITFFNKYDPDTKNETGRLALYYLTNKNYEKANRFADIFLERQPESYYSQLTKGKILFEQNEVDQAKKYFKIAYNTTVNFWAKWEMQQYFKEKGITFKE